MIFRTRTLLTAAVGVVGMTIGALAPHYIANVYAADQPPPAPPAAVGPVDGPDITLDIAHKAIEAAVRKAMELNIKQNVAVVDAGGNLKAFARMDEAWLGSIDIAQKKAKTSRLFDMKTGDIGALSQPGKPLYMIEVSNQGLITFPGGVPIRNNQGKVIGAIGVSGSTVDKDDACATAGADAVMGKK